MALNKNRLFDILIYIISFLLNFLTWLIWLNIHSKWLLSCRLIADCTSIKYRSFIKKCNNFEMHEADRLVV